MITALMTLALGISADTEMFNVIHSAMLNSSPFLHCGFFRLG
jgi:hypothetical protein